MSETVDRLRDAPAPEERMLAGSSSEYVTAIAHLYRGELSRMVAWRDRLDHTTNWAIAASAAMLSVTLSSPDSHHAVILCCKALVLLLLLIEARRYRFFEVSRHRVRLIERNYYARLIERSHPPDPENWRELLSADLRCPRFTYSLVAAIRHRVRRNYIWIYLTLLVSWWLKVTTVVLEARTGDAAFVHSWGELMRNASVSYIPGYLVVPGVILCHSVLAAIAMGKAPKECGDEADV